MKLLAQLSSGLVTSLAVMLVCVPLQALVPHTVGPEFLLIRYRGELIAIDLVGAVIPLVVSMILILAVLLMGMKKSDGPAFRKLGFWFGILTIALVSTAAFTFASAEYGGLNLPVSWSIAFIPGGTAIGVAFRLSRGKDEELLIGFVECYVLGTLAMLVSDLLRTLSGLVRAPALSWGGDGSHDLVFWFGLYVGPSYLLFSLLYPRLLGLFSRAGEMEIRVEMKASGLSPVVGEGLEPSET